MLRSVALAPVLLFGGLVPTAPSVHAENPKKGLQLAVTGKSDAFGTATGREAEWNGTRGLGKPLRGFAIKIDEPVEGLGIRYKGHFAGSGDSEWCENGQLLERGTQLEGIVVELTGPAASKYRVQYQTHLAFLGDSDVFEDGEFCGTRGEGRRCEAIVIVVKRK